MGRHERKAGCRRHLDDGDIANQAVRAVHRLSQRALDGDGTKLAAHAGNQRIYGALTAVGQGTDQNLRVGIDATRALSDGLSGLQ